MTILHNGQSKLSTVGSMYMIIKYLETQPRSPHRELADVVKRQRKDAKKGAYTVCKRKPKDNGETTLNQPAY